MFKPEPLDPATAWQPPDPQPWDLKWAAHLYRRAGFGVPAERTFPGSEAWERLELAVEQGPQNCIDQLLAGADAPAGFYAMLDDMGTRFASINKLEMLQGWWFYRMVNTPHPLQERLTLFWHNHFATSAAKVTSLPLMLRQNQLLRKHALGSFRHMLLEMGRDPAMLLWLDSNSNVKGHPNENYAREVMELFSLGVGNYTEKDIQEAARAFTGWKTENGEFAFDESQHDDGPKTILGETGNFDGDDVVRIVLQQDVAARFLVRKLYREFISEAAEPSDELLEPLAAQLRESDYDIAACVGTMLRSRAFFSEHAYRQRIKSPVEYLMGLLAVFDAQISLNSLAQASESLGQSLFHPPNVKGWDGGQSWLNTATLMERHNLAWRLVGGQDTIFQKSVNLLPALKKHGHKTPEDQVRFLLKIILQEDVPLAAQHKLMEFVRSKNGGRPGTLDNDVWRELTHTMLLMPEYQLA